MTDLGTSNVATRRRMNSEVNAFSGCSVERKDLLCGSGDAIVADGRASDALRASLANRDSRVDADDGRHCPLPKDTDGNATRAAATRGTVTAEPACAATARVACINRCATATRFFLADLPGGTSPSGTCIRGDERRTVKDDERFEREQSYRAAATFAGSTAVAATAAAATTTTMPGSVQAGATAAPLTRKTNSTVST